MKKIFLGILIFIIGFLISYNVGFKKAIKTNKIQSNITTIEDACLFSEYQTFDVDGDGLINPETIVVEHVGMSQFAGRILIIDEGKIVFTSDVKMRIRVNPMSEDEQENGFIISYSTEPNSNTAIVRDFYKYINGKYILEKTENN